LLQILAQKTFELPQVVLRVFYTKLFAKNGSEPKSFSRWSNNLSLLSFIYLFKQLYKNLLLLYFYE